MGKFYTDYTKLDQKLFQMASIVETNLLKFINPQNSTEQKSKFFELLSRGEKYEPGFSYIPRNPLYSYFAMNPLLDTYMRELKEMIKEVSMDELGVIFESEILDLLDKIEMIKSIGTENFSGNSESYYGSIDRKTLSFAKEFVEKKVEEKFTPISFDFAINEINSFLEKKKLPHRVKVREPSGARFAVINSSKEVLVNSDTIFSKEMLARLIAHEIETHIYRYENGVRQPYKLLAHGFSRETTQTEEGLAVCVEKMKGVSSNTQIKEYAGRVIAINTAQKHCFTETFQEMCKYFSEDDSFRLTLRAKRGIKNQEKPGAFFKDALYLRGMLHVEEFLKEHSYKELYFAKCAIEDIPLVRAIAGLKEPKYLPDFSTN